MQKPRGNILFGLIQRERGYINGKGSESIYNYAEDKAAKSPTDNIACDLRKTRTTFLVAFSRDMTKMASTHGDRHVHVTDTRTGKSLHVLKGHSRSTWCVSFHPTSNHILASGCLGGQVRIWDLQGEGSECWVSPKQTVIASLTFHPTENFIAIATSNQILFWDWSQPKPFASIFTGLSTEKVRLVKFDTLGHHLITGIANVSSWDNVQDLELSLPREHGVQGMVSENFPHRPIDGQQVQRLRNELLQRFTTINDANALVEAAFNLPDAQSRQAAAAAAAAQTSTNSGHATSTSANSSNPATANPSLSQPEEESAALQPVPSSSHSPSRPEGQGGSSRKKRRLTSPRADQPLTSTARHLRGSSSKAAFKRRAKGVRPQALISKRVRLDLSGGEGEAAVPSTSQGLGSELGTGDGGGTGGRAVQSTSKGVGSEPTQGSQGNNKDSRDDGREAGVVESTGQDDTGGGAVLRPAKDVNTSNGRGADGPEASGVGSTTKGAESRPKSTSQATLQWDKQSRSNASSDATGATAASHSAYHPGQLHHHYSVSIFDDDNRPSLELHSAINRAIAGAFAGSGEVAVANNIVNTSYRLQCWEFNRNKLPDLTDFKARLLVSRCKLFSDASCDISPDGRFLATFVPSCGFPDDNILGIFSLQPDNFGECMFTRSFGPNAISVSLSPLSRYVLVGHASRKLHLEMDDKQMVAQIFQLHKPYSGEDSLLHIHNVMHPINVNARDYVSINSARFLPEVGRGLVYGTNKGQIHMCRPRSFREDHQHKSCTCFVTLTPDPVTGETHDNMYSRRNVDTGSRVRDYQLVGVVGLGLSLGSASSSMGTQTTGQEGGAGRPPEETAGQPGEEGGHQAQAAGRDHGHDRGDGQLSSAADGAASEYSSEGVSGAAVRAEECPLDTDGPHCSATASIAEAEDSAEGLSDSSAQQ